jgi:class 3 adenylate cyclase
MQSAAGEGKANRVRAWATAVAVVSLVLAADGVVLLGVGIAGGWVPIGDPGTAETVPTVALFAILCPVIGWIITRRQPANALGWVYLAVGFWQSLNMVSSGYSSLDFEAAHQHLPLGDIGSWLAVWAWVPGFTLFTTLGVILFPSGRLPSRRWWPVPALAGLALLLQAVPSAVAAWPYRGTQLEAAALSNGPPDIHDPVFAAAQGMQFIGQLVLLMAMLGAFAGLVVRFRRAASDERQQLKWFTYAALVDVATLVAWMTVGLNAPLAFVSGIIFGSAIPVAVGLAILRYRLYDIDLLVNRTALYGIVGGVLLIGFAVGDVVLQAAVARVAGGSSQLITTGLALGAGLAFMPLLRRIRPLVDRVLPGRARLTLLFTDIVGSTQAIVELGDERWRGLLTRYLAAVRLELARFHGHEVNTAGDAFFATFGRPMAGLQCAYAIRASVQQLGLQTRTGVHLGDVEMRGEQLSGLAVHTAARVMAEADPGEVLISESMREVIQVPEVQLRDRGRHELRGVPGEWQLYAVETLSSAS